MPLLVCCTVCHGPAVDSVTGWWTGETNWLWNVNPAMRVVCSRERTGAQTVVIMERFLWKGGKSFWSCWVCKRAYWKLKLLCNCSCICWCFTPWLWCISIRFKPRPRSIEAFLTILKGIQATSALRMRGDPKKNQNRSISSPLLKMASESQW